MDESQRLGVKGLAREGDVQSAAARPAVDRITHDRMLDRSQMNADLMRASGLEPAG